MIAIWKVQAVDVHHTVKSKQTTVCTVGWDSVISTATSKFKTHRFVYIPMCCSKVTFPFQVDWCGSNAPDLFGSPQLKITRLQTILRHISHCSPSSPQENAEIFVFVVYLITLSRDLH